MSGFTHFKGMQLNLFQNLINMSFIIHINITQKKIFWKNIMLLFSLTISNSDHRSLSSNVEIHTGLEQHDCEQMMAECNF